MSEKRVIADLKGRQGEDQAAAWLNQQGWEILARRVKTKLGEIDLIARQENLVAFIEVKWRRRAADLATAIDERRLAYSWPIASTAAATLAS
ncbi:MAG: YraN family protein, partial [Pseudomonadota bacterium]